MVADDEVEEEDEDEAVAVVHLAAVGTGEPVREDVKGEKKEERSKTPVPSCKLRRHTAAHTSWARVIQTESANEDGSATGRR